MYALPNNSSPNTLNIWPLAYGTNQKKKLKDNTSKILAIITQGGRNPGDFKFSTFEFSSMSCITLFLKESEHYF